MTEVNLAYSLRCYSWPLYELGLDRVGDTRFLQSIVTSRASELEIVSIECENITSDWLAIELRYELQAPT